MNEPLPQTPLSPPKQPSQWVIAATCCALLMVATAGGIFAMRDRLIADARDTAEEQKEAMESLDRRVEQLSSSLSTLENAPKMDEEAIGMIKSELADIKSAVESLQQREGAIDARIKTLEDNAAAAKEIKATEDARSAVANATEVKMMALSGKSYLAEWSSWSVKHPQEAKNFTHLQSFAATGIPLESDLRSSLRDVLKDIKLPTKVDDTSMIGKINTHLHGLVSIRKAGESSEIGKLRLIAERDDLETAAKAVEASGAAENSKSLRDWFDAYTRRNKALEELGRFGVSAELAP